MFIGSQPYYDPHTRDIVEHSGTPCTPRRRYRRDDAMAQWPNDARTTHRWYKLHARRRLMQPIYVCVCVEHIYMYTIYVGLGTHILCCGPVRAHPMAYTPSHVSSLPDMMSPQMYDTLCAAAYIRNYAARIYIAGLIIWPVIWGRRCCIWATRRLVRCCDAPSPSSIYSI